jgi:uracil-DNA glycosylase family 4
MILDSPAGREWESGVSLGEASKQLRGYYLCDPPNSFHQMELRKILKWLDDRNLRWYVTDLVKCYVHNDTNNREKAEEECYAFLSKQIAQLRPRKVVMFGKTVLDMLDRKGLTHFDREGRKQRSSSIHGKVFEGSGMLGGATTIFSIFPSQWTADVWILMNALETLKREICQAMGSPMDINNR